MRRRYLAGLALVVVTGVASAFWPPAALIALAFLLVMLFGRMVERESRQAGYVAGRDDEHDEWASGFRPGGWQ